MSPVIYIKVRIKSRAFSVTFGTFYNTWVVPVGAVDVPFDKDLHDARGVFVRVFSPHAGAA